MIENVRMQGKVSLLFCSFSPNPPEKAFLEIRDRACSPFLSSCLLFFFVCSSLLFSPPLYPDTSSSLVRMLYPCFSSLDAILDCTSLPESHRKSPLETTFGNPSCSAIEQREKGKARSLETLLLVSPPNRGEEEGGMRRRKKKKKRGELYVLALSHNFF